MSVYFSQKNGFASQQALWASIMKELATNGMQVVSVNGIADAEIGETITSCVLEATQTVDPLATEQPWRLCCKVDAISVRLYAAPPTQISDAGNVSKVARQQVKQDLFMPIYSGTIGNFRPGGFGSDVNPPAALLDTFFYHKGMSKDEETLFTPGSMQFSGGEGPASLTYVDDAAMPFSYMVSISDHGIAVGTSIESRDNEGCRQNWFAIQRPINPDGSVVTSGFAPLFCLYSVSGGGSPDANTVWAGGIMRFTVREKDVNAPSFATSAVAHSPDSFAVMNPIQQVTFNEAGRYDFRFPAGLNTHRTSYPYEIDMIGYGSADVSSHKVGVELQVYKEVDEQGNAKLRKYRAFAANSPCNTGMRLFILETM